MKKLIKHEGEFSTKLFRAYRDNLDDLVCCAFSYDQLESYARGRYDHPNQIMSLETAREFAKYYSGDMKEWGEDWNYSDNRPARSGDEKTHEHATSAFVNYCSNAFDRYGELADKVNDSSKTINEHEIIMATKNKNKTTFEKIVSASALGKNSDESSHVILYHVSGEDSTVYYFNTDLDTLINNLGNHYRTGHLVAHTQTGEIAITIQRVMDTLKHNDYYKKISARAQNELYKNNSTVPGFIKALKKLLGDRKITIERDLDDRVEDLQQAYEIEKHQKKFYSYIPGKGADKDVQFDFTDPVKALAFYLADRYEHFGLLVGDKNIAACLKNGGDEIIKKQMPPALRRETLKKIAAKAEYHRWVLPKAYAVQNRAQAKSARSQ